jgi:hypothetical protein
LNQAHNRAPRKTNPQGKPGLCKHVLAAREYVYGLLSTFPGDEPDTAEKLNKLTKYATHRWANFPQLMRQAKEREAEIKQRIAQRNLGRPVGPDELEKVKLQPPKPLEAPKPPKVPAPKEPLKAAEPAKAEKAKVPEVPPAPLPSTKKASAPVGAKAGGANAPTPPVAKEQSKAASARKKPTGPGAYGWLRPESKIEQKQTALVESVVKANAELMTTLQEARKLVREMEDDALSFAGPAEAPGAPPMDGADAVEPLDPMEPPISDTAIGADTEGDTALGLLRQMTDLLTQLVTALAPEAGMGGEGMPGEGMPGEMGEMPPGAEGLPGDIEGAEGGAEGGGEMPGEPPIDVENPDSEFGAEGGEGEASKEKAEGGEEGEEHEKKEKEVEENRSPRNRRPVA